MGNCVNPKEKTQLHADNPDSRTAIRDKEEDKMADGVGQSTKAGSNEIKPNQQPNKPIPVSAID